MKKMSLAREIKVQKLQTKNRMVGETFNPNGHTSESLKTREQKYIEEINLLNIEDQIKIHDSFKAIEEWKREENIFMSNSFEHNCFMRNFSYLNQ